MPISESGAIGNGGGHLSGETLSIRVAGHLVTFDGSSDTQPIPGSHHVSLVVKVIIWALCNESSIRLSSRGSIQITSPCTGGISECGA